MGQTVAILGASEKPKRFAYKAFHMLKEFGHKPILINPKLKSVENTPVLESLASIQEPVDTLTMYVRPEISSQLKADIMQLHPKRVIFNPGTENPELKSALEENGIHTVEQCTLVLLQTQRFDDA